MQKGNWEPIYTNKWEPLYMNQWEPLYINKKRPGTWEPLYINKCEPLYTNKKRPVTFMQKGKCEPIYVNKKRIVTFSVWNALYMYRLKVAILCAHFHEEYGTCQNRPIINEKRPILILSYEMRPIIIFPCTYRSLFIHVKWFSDYWYV